MSKKIIKQVKASIKKGAMLKEALASAGISDNKWRTILREEGVQVQVPRSNSAKTYTPERVKLVKERLKTGAYLKDICDSFLRIEKFV